MDKSKKRSKEEASPNSLTTQPEKRLNECSTDMNLSFNPQSPSMLDQLPSKQYAEQYMPPHLQYLNGASPVPPPTQYLQTSPTIINSDQSLLKSIVDKLSNIEKCQKKYGSKAGKTRQN